MLHFCSRNLHTISDQAKWLLKEFPNETRDLYRQWLFEKAKDASNRSNYRQVCRKIQAYQKLFGDEYTSLIVETLVTSYPKRTAFLDELQKIKIKGL